MRTAYIYMIINVINGKFYIGSAWDYKRRISQHKSELRHNRHANSYLQRSWNKFGEEAFEFEILEEFEAKDREEKFLKEQLYMDILQPYGERGYNQSKKANIGGFCGSDGQSPTIRKYTDEQIIEVKKLLSEGLSNKEIEQITQVRRETISAIRTFREYKEIGSEYNLALEKLLKEKEYRREIDGKEKEIYELYESGLKYKDIAKYFGLDCNKSIYSLLSKAKVRYENSNEANGKRCLCCGKVISNRKGNANSRKYCKTCSRRIKTGEIKRIKHENGEITFEKKNIDK